MARARTVIVNEKRTFMLSKDDNVGGK